MKTMCLYDLQFKGYKDQMAIMKDYATGFGGDPVVIEGWDDPTNNGDLTASVLRIEKNGPETEPIHPAFSQNKDTEVLEVSFCPVSSTAMDLFDKLRVIGVCRMGYENVNVQAATQRDILVVNASGRNANAVSDYSIGLMLAESRNIARQHALMACEGGQQKVYSNNDIIPDMCGKTVGLYGFGIIGRLVAQKLSGFEVKVLYYDPFVDEAAGKEYGATKVDKETLFRESDYISVHARQSKENYHDIGADEFTLMKPTAYFINTARANMVDYDALLKVLQEHKIAGAALDVYPSLPLAEDSPLRKLDNLTMSCHLAGSTRDAIVNSSKYVFQRIAKAVKGSSTFGVLNPEVLESTAFKNWAAANQDKLNIVE